jgi:hypothetical protein
VQSDAGILLRVVFGDTVFVLLQLNCCMINTIICIVKTMFVQDFATCFDLEGRHQAKVVQNM